MTRRPAFLTLEQADARLGELSPWLSAAGQPRKQVQELLCIAAFYRGEVDRLMVASGEKKRPGFAELVEQKRKG